MHAKPTAVAGRKQLARRPCGQRSETPGQQGAEGMCAARVNKLHKLEVRLWPRSSQTKKKAQQTHPSTTTVLVSLRSMAFPTRCPAAFHSCTFNTFAASRSWPQGKQTGSPEVLAWRSAKKATRSDKNCSSLHSVSGGRLLLQGQAAGSPGKTQCEACNAWWSSKTVGAACQEGPRRSSD